MPAERAFSTDDSYVGRLGTLVALGHFKFNFVTLSKGFEALPLNCGVVHKYVLLALNFDKSKTLPIIEPFHFTRHWNLHQASKDRLDEKLKTFSPPQRSTLQKQKVSFSTDIWETKSG